MLEGLVAEIELRHGVAVESFAAVGPRRGQRVCTRWTVLDAPPRLGGGGARRTTAAASRSRRWPAGRGPGRRGRCSAPPQRAAESPGA